MIPIAGKPSQTIQFAMLCYTGQVSLINLTTVQRASFESVQSNQVKPMSSNLYM
ncbi:predicted protein [Botrytis cinerea T4]|uniref:Uncharacterized protein n=1 Tax=Botryotinia fuckeliana (strain T4) TaxID=999810 RepID=G2XXY2_BOTF4|nr:predicted protein [Botrytis cinerea T4]